MKQDNHHLLDIVGEIGFEWRKNDEIKKKWGQKSNLGVLKMKELCFCFADI